MKKLLIILLLFVSINPSYSQDIFNDLKKIGDQLQKNIDIKPNQSGPETITSKDTKIETKNINKIVPFNNNVFPKLSLFGVLLLDNLYSLKLSNKKINLKEINLKEEKCLEGVENGKPWVVLCAPIIGDVGVGDVTGTFKDDRFAWDGRVKEFIYLYANEIFEPKEKSDLFEHYIAIYTPTTKKIQAIFGFTKKNFQSKEQCEQELKPILPYLAKKYKLENPNFEIFNISSYVYEKGNFTGKIILKYNENIHVIAIGTKKLYKNIEVPDYKALMYQVCFNKPSRGFIVLRTPNTYMNINSEYSEIIKKMLIDDTPKKDNKQIEKELKGL